MPKRKQFRWEGAHRKASYFNGSIAHMGGVQSRVSLEAHNVGLRAHRNLIAHRHSGTARIMVHPGKGSVIKGLGSFPDWYVTLYDKNVTNTAYNMNSAASIEYGRAGFYDPKAAALGIKATWGATKPTWILHDAAGLRRIGRPAGERRASMPIGMMTRRLKAKGVNKMG